MEKLIVFGVVKGVLKCQKKYKSKFIADMLTNDSAYLRKDDQGEIYLHPNHNYMYKVRTHVYSRILILSLLRVDN